MKFVSVENSSYYLEKKIQMARSRRTKLEDIGQMEARIVIRELLEIKPNEGAALYCIQEAQEISRME